MELTFLLGREMVRNMVEVMITFVILGLYGFGWNLLDSISLH